MGVGRHLLARVHGLVSGGNRRCDMWIGCPYLVGSGGVSIGARFLAEIVRFNEHVGESAGNLMSPMGKECMRGLATGVPHSARPGGQRGTGRLLTVADILLSGPSVSGCQSLLADLITVPGRPSSRSISCGARPVTLCGGSVDGPSSKPSRENRRRRRGTLA